METESCGYWHTLNDSRAVKNSSGDGKRKPDVMRKDINTTKSSIMDLQVDPDPAKV